MNESIIFLSGTLCLVAWMSQNSRKCNKANVSTSSTKDLVEKQKMLDGKLYCATGPLLTNERDMAHHKCWEFTHLYGGSTECHTKQRAHILRNLLGSFDNTFPPWIEPGLVVDYGYNIHVGKRFYANYGFVVLDCARVTIGDDVMCGPSVSLYTAYHPLQPSIRNFAPSGKGLEQASPITIGNSCWIGGGAILLPGVVLGDNVTVAAGAVVVPGNSAIEAGNCLVAGVPARVVKDIVDC